jgi:hypothetical protein
LVPNCLMGTIAAVGPWDTICSCPSSVVSCTRILLPLSLVVGFILILQGTPMGFDGRMQLTTLEGDGR